MTKENKKAILMKSMSQNELSSKHFHNYQHDEKNDGKKSCAAAKMMKHKRKRSEPQVISSMLDV